MRTSSLGVLCVPTDLSVIGLGALTGAGVCFG
jgi:hypothetical protein